jgi:hypothetical protein
LQTKTEGARRPKREKSIAVNWPSQERVTFAWTGLVIGPIGHTTVRLTRKQQLTTAGIQRAPMVMNLGVIHHIIKHVGITVMSPCVKVSRKIFHATMYFWICLEIMDPLLNGRHIRPTF